MRKRPLFALAAAALIVTAGASAFAAARPELVDRGPHRAYVPATNGGTGIPTTAPTSSTAPPTPTPAPGMAPVIGGCQVLPDDNPWNQDVSGLPVHPNSDAYVASIDEHGRNRFLHADFGGGGEYGIPYVVVPGDQPSVPIDFVDFGDESDPGPYPVPLDAPVENSGDRHVLVLQQGACMLYELFNAERSGAGWEASSGAVFDLSTNALRPLGWTSADAAGLPVLPGLVRYDEVLAGEVTHAVRFTASATQRGYMLPATHFASGNTSEDLPPMGLRLRLKADFDTSGYDGHARVILEGLKRYGMILADNGTSWFITGASDPRWDDEDLDQLKTVPGSAFEAVYTGDVITD